MISAARVTTHVVFERLTAKGSISKPVATSCSALISVKPNFVLHAFMISARMEPDPQDISIIRGASPPGRLSMQRCTNNYASQLGVHSWPRSLRWLRRASCAIKRPNRSCSWRWAMSYAYPWGFRFISHWSLTLSFRFPTGNSYASGQNLRRVTAAYTD